ncbi:MAG TPA: hypothetical protein VGG16_04035 [Streptosporangiaceae bacterium]|jgi:hypothetical protein
MPVLPRVVLAASALAVSVLAVGGIAGCSSFNAALGQQQAIVTFKTNATIAQRLAVRSTCGKLPAVTKQSLPDLKKYPYALEELTLGVSKASDSQVADLEKCLNNFPAVLGVSFQDSSDDG